MKKLILILSLVAILCLTACSGGVKLDENEHIVGNGTWQVTKGDDVYAIMSNFVTKNDVEILTADNIKDYKLFALGEYLYFNTTEGAVQVTLDGKDMKKFGSGDILMAKGRYIYYQSTDNKVGTMIVYKIDMVDGSILQLFQDTITEVEMIDEDVFLFKGESGNEYINELGSDEGMFYSQYTGEDIAQSPSEEATE